jgi:chromosome segregation protein
MHLKHLQVQGYKSFAGRAEFAFDDGVTAIIGPNGSGKSNVADAIRWVLGEQSYSTLRGKRTEDMIFAGSTARSRVGMAHVQMTLDNTDRTLPIDYAEVTIERRAYRSGENEYLINGNRVRLKDINDLLAAAGLSRRTYAVIGQGLIDAALSLRPEERRVLFEEAAGITGHQGKRADAVNRLHETAQNIIRVNDIINEIKPQLGRMQKQADQANEHARIGRELGGMLMEWYGYRWYQAQQALAVALARARTQDGQVVLRQAELEAMDHQAAESRARQAELRVQTGEWHRQSSGLHTQSERTGRDLAVRQERRRLLERQREDLVQEIVPLQASYEAQTGRLQEAEVELVALAGDLEGQKAALVELDSQIEALQAERKRLLAERTAGQNGIFQATTQAADRRNRVAQLGERREAIGTEKQEHAHAVAAITARAKEIEVEVVARVDALAAIDGQIEELKAAQSTLQAGVIERREDLARMQAQMGEARREWAQLQARQETLDRLREDMSNYYDGVRAVLSGSGAERRQLTGLLGTVANLVQVDPALEKAVETALGAHLQDVVAESWGSAQAAIEYLKKNRAGRATFLPLDDLRPAPPSPRAPAGQGVIGLALGLVKFETRLRPVFELLLGHTVIVEDLAVAHRVFRDLRGGFQIVTRDGEIVRSSGAISGGEARTQQAGLLAREREARELPAKVAAAAERSAALEKQAQQASDAIREAQARMDRGDAQGRALRSQREAVLSQIAALKQDGAQLTREVEWRRKLSDQLGAEFAALDQKEAALKAEQSRLQGQAAADEARQVQVAARLAELDGDPALDAALALRTQVAVAGRAIDNQRVIVENHRIGLPALQRQIEGKERRVQETAAEIDGLVGETERLSAEAATLADALAALAAQIAPAESELNAIERSLSEIGQMEAALRNRLHAQESLSAQAHLEVQRRRDELDNLRRQMEEEIGLVDTDLIETTETQQPLPLGELVARLPTVTQLPSGLEDEIRRLKAQRARLGTINPNAPAEYDGLMGRYTFLSNQAEDLQQAATTLQAVIGELDQLIARDFTTTFRQIAGHFKDFFGQLFGGGSAKLVLTDPDNPLTTGIDISVRPPGKRQQMLNLLSGGERALTAAALIFAILKVSPTPFCVLDEVDAMLDEANVGRFRDGLKVLATDTQFILITHNRRTVEAARTIYGISMGDDKASVVMSLKLDGAVDEEASSQSVVALK